MTRWIAAMLAVVGLIGTGTAYAQESAPGTGAVVVTIIPGGGTRQGRLDTGECSLNKEEDR
jgi:hypothetical protein